MPLTFKLPVQDCDVDDCDSLDSYRTKLAEWHECLEGEDAHAIWKQLYQLAWNDAAFRVFNECRRVALQWGGGFAAINPLIAHFLDQGYVSAMVLGLRRLTDPPQRNVSRQVVSLVRLVEDLKLNSHLLTRQNIVCGTGLPFDVASARARSHQGILSQMPIDGFSTEDIGGPGDYDSAVDRHREFARFAAGGASPSRHEIVDLAKLNSLSGKLTSVAQDIREFGNKFIAHAADPASRATLTLDQQGVSIAKIEAAIAGVVGVAAQISRLLFDVNHGQVLPMGGDYKFENFPMPWVPDVGVASSRQVWEDYAIKTREWARVP